MATWDPMSLRAHPDRLAAARAAAAPRASLAQAWLWWRHDEEAAARLHRW